MNLAQKMRGSVSTTNTWLAVSAFSVSLVCLFSILIADDPVALLIRESVDLPLRALFDDITDLGKAGGYIFICLILFGVCRFLFLRTAPKPIARAYYQVARLNAFILATLAVSAIPVHIMKLSFGRPRPYVWFRDNIHDFQFLAFDTSLSSFPSGHSQTIWAVMTPLILVFPKRTAIFASIAILVALSRVIVSAHYPSDVIMGSFIAIASAVLLKQCVFADLRAPDFAFHFTATQKAKIQFSEELHKS